MSKNKNIIRVNDRVEIITPLIYIRTGYPLTAQIVKDTLITKSHKDAIIVMLKAFGIRKYSYDFAGFSDKEIKLADKLYEKVIHIMSMAIMEYNGWGGTERKIYTENRPNLTGGNLSSSQQKDS